MLLLVTIAAARADGCRPSAWLDPELDGATDVPTDALFEWSQGDDTYIDAFLLDADDEVVPASGEPWLTPSVPLEPDTEYSVALIEDFEPYLVRDRARFTTGAGPTTVSEPPTIERIEVGEYLEPVSTLPSGCGSHPYGWEVVARVRVGDADALSEVTLSLAEPRSDALVYLGGDVAAAAGDEVELVANVTEAAEVCFAATLFDAARNPHVSAPECVEVRGSKRGLGCATAPGGGVLGLALAGLAIRGQRRKVRSKRASACSS